MASVTKEGKLIKVRFDKSDWLRGIVNGGNAYSFDSLEGDGLTYVISMNPNRYPGYLAPGFEYADVTNMSSITNNATIKNIAQSVAGGGFGYGIENNSKFHQINTLTGAITATGGYPRTLAGTSPVGSDVVRYMISGTEYIFASYNENTNGYIARLAVSAGTWTDPFTPGSGSLTLNKNYPHPMIVGDDDILYIANGREIVAYDGVANVASTLAFSVPDGFIITSFAKHPNFLVVFCSTKTAYDSAPGSSYAFFWDYASADATYKYDLNCAYVNGAFSFKGNLGVFGQRQSFSRNKSLMMMFNGSIFETVATFVEQIPGHGGVDIVDEMILFSAGDFGNLGAGRIYSYGSLGKGYDNALQQIGSGGGTEGGGVLFATGSSYTTGYLASFGSSGGELNVFNSGFGDSSTFYTALKDIDFGRYGMGKVVGVKVVYKDKVTTGKTFSFGLNTDSSGTTVDIRGTQTTIVDQKTSQATLVEHYELGAGGIELPQITNSIGIWGTWSGGVKSEAHTIHSVEIFIELVSTTS